MTAPTTIVPAQLHERFLARLIDALITIPLTVMISWLAADHEGLATVGAFAGGVLFQGYMLSSRWRATPGKMLLGLKVFSASGAPLSLPHACSRELAVQMPTYPVYLSFIAPQIAQPIVMALMLIWFLPVLLREDRQAVHDRLCFTKVLRIRS